MEASERIITPKFRIIFADVFRPRENRKDDGSVTMEYSVMAAFPPGTDFTQMNALIAAAAAKKWGPDKATWPKPLRNPIRANEEKEQKGVLPDGLERGGHFINIKTTIRPGVVDQNVQPILDESEFYRGCYAIAQIDAYGYEVKGNKGVSFGLQNIQKVADGEPLSGRQRAEDAFQPVAGAATPATGGASGDPFA